ncbi:MAG: hypothetical protein KBE50_06175 [Fervidobacterium sp.]|nr:hypothetical protein [Fervidobacterium sp.]HQI93287.1 hypothetical protein [Fervidobacterium sp.]
MARKGFSISKIRSAMYQSAKILGDVEAVSKGPKAVGKRVKRRLFGKFFGRILRRL